VLTAGDTLRAMPRCNLPNANQPRELASLRRPCEGLQAKRVPLALQQVAVRDSAVSPANKRGPPYHRWWLHFNNYYWPRGGGSRAAKRPVRDCVRTCRAKLLDPPRMLGEWWVSQTRPTLLLLIWPANWLRRFVGVARVERIGGRLLRAGR
jgi:hypothetical protein